MATSIKRFAGAFQVFFVTAVVGTALLFSVSLKPASSASPSVRAAQSVSVSVVEPVEMAYRPTVRLNGVVEARTITEVIPQVAGRIIEVSPAFRPGSYVAKGDVLFRIDPVDYELAIERTLAEIEGARSELALLEAQAQAEKQVWNQQVPDRKIPDLIARVPQIAAAKARIRSGLASRAAAELSLSRTVVRAPFAARVLKTRLDVGQVVGVGNTVGAIFSIDSVEIAVPVSSEELALIGDAIGKTALIARAGAANFELTAEVVRQAAELDQSTRLGTLFVAADDPAALALGDFVNVEISGQEVRETFLVPSASLTSQDQVWVVDGGQLQERQVEVLGSENDVAIVRAFDLAEGIVAVPPANVRNGLAVSVQMERALVSTSGGSPVGAK